MGRNVFKNFEITCSFAVVAVKKGSSCLSLVQENNSSIWSQCNFEGKTNVNASGV